MPPIVGGVKHSPFIERARYCAGLFSFYRDEDKVMDIWAYSYCFAQKGGF